MKTKFLKITVIGLFGLTMVSCQKTDVQNEDQMIVNNEQVLNSLQTASNVTVEYLLNLISSIEAMKSEGLISEGHANSLISKLNNAIKSINKGNINAAKGQLNAVINEIESLIDNGIITEEQGDPLITGTENGIILSEGGFSDPNDGYKYSIVLIDDQLWMAENLKAVKYNDGTEIPLVKDDKEWADLKGPGYCWYTDESNNIINTYGPLYNWFAVNTGKLCPSGWHVPTNEEWHELILYLDPDAVEPEPSEMVVWESLIAGDNLKEAGTTHWNSPNTGTNSSGFTALPGGFRRYEGSFHSIGGYGDWWTTSEFDGENAWRRFMSNSSGYVWWDRLSKNYGFSIRCLKN